ncbi:MAG: riboflavin synthase [Armatimonadetes bacterium]|nr:riboflavin synthase [Armatimonadota bacterium]
MFTGIIEELGSVVALERRGNLVRLRMRAGVVLSDARLGDSISHNGVCLTIAELSPPTYACDIMQETLRRTTLGSLRVGEAVNLERALAAGGRFGGHFVQGHVDGVGQLAAITREAEWVTYAVTAPPEVLRYVVAKGSIAVDGISLTVVEKLADRFTVSLIPHTLGLTTLGGRRVGETVNLEADVLAKYVAAALGVDRGGGGTITLEGLAEQGY